MNAAYIFRWQDKMHKRAQVLIIFLWILVVLVILVVSISQRASTTLRFIRYQKNKQEALSLAKAGIKRAIVELKKDKNTNTYDRADELPVFKNTELLPGSGETFSVNVTDEAGKIDLNTASQDLLTVLLKDSGIDNAEEIARNILVWRGKIIDDTAYEGLGYPPKEKDFVNTQELILVKGMTPQDYQKVKDAVTVYTDGLININAAPERVLKIFACGLAPDKEGIARSVAEKIIALKNNSGGYFQEKNEIDIPITGDDELNIFNELINHLSVKSDNYFIEATGRTGKIESKVNVVYNRQENKFLYWYED